MRHPRIVFIIGALVLAAPGILTAASGASAAEATCPQGNGLVCAMTPDGKQSEFANACLAANANARVLNAGECQRVFCMELYQPVCATNPGTGRPQTYSNQCFADAAKATLIAPGPCR